MSLPVCLLEASLVVRWADFASWIRFSELTFSDFILLTSITEEAQNVENGGYRSFFTRNVATHLAAVSFERVVHYRAKDYEYAD